MIAILLVGLFIAIFIGTLSVNAISIKNQIVDPVVKFGGFENGDIGAFVFYEQIGKTSDDPRIVPIKNAKVFCTDINDVKHDMIYQEIEPGFFAYVAFDIPAGECEITASKDGYSTEIISAFIFSGGFDIYRIELDKSPIYRSIFQNLFDTFVHAFPILRLLLMI